MSAEPATIAYHAKQTPERAAIVMAETGHEMSYAELDGRSDALARQLAAAGLVPGDTVAVLMPNSPGFLVAAWAAERSGLYYVPVNWHLKRDEVHYVINDCGAGAMLCDPSFVTLVEQKPARRDALAIWYDRGIGPSGFVREEETDPVLKEYRSMEGSSMIYSSGTSGFPKGIRRPLAGSAPGELTAGDRMLRELYGWSKDTVLLCPSPLYHAAPLNFTMSTHRAGGTAVVMQRFDAETALAAIERFCVNKLWLVPTMMIRMLNLPKTVRSRFDPDGVTHVIHSAAPCPVDTKRAFIDWFGRTVYEFYAASEANGFVAIGPDEWLAHPGSVGRSDNIRICGEDGEALPSGQIGLIYFAQSWTSFEYNNDPEKTRAGRNRHGWTTLGDLGRLDGEGYLYLADRQTNLILSGGVNIYPQEAENILTVHPDVYDVAVIGVPNAEFGQEVKAVVALKDGIMPTDGKQAELIRFCRERLADFKCPRSVDFVDALPRLPTGKLLKRELHKRYE